MPTDTPKLTVQELALAERIALFLAPTLREAIATRVNKPRDTDATIETFCREFRDAMRAPDTADTPRVEVDARLLALASDFVAARTKG